MIEITKRGRFTELIAILQRSRGFVIRAPTNSNHVLLIVLENNTLNCCIIFGHVLQIRDSGLLSSLILPSKIKKSPMSLDLVKIENLIVFIIFIY
jgi:hypothetical protein